ncbi:MAG: hypothetical protein ACRDGM_02260 [bacterium]
MTAIVGVFCKDGAVIGTDSSATFTAGQSRTIEQQTEKIHIVDDHIIIACTGAIGLYQRFCAIVGKIWKDNGFTGSEIEVAKRLSRETLQDLAQTFLQPTGFGATIAFPIQHRPHLCEFLPDNFQPELKTNKLWYCSMGSGQQITDPFLGLMREVFWEKGPPSLQEGVFAVTWALDHVITLNPGGVKDPISIAVLEKLGDGKARARRLEPTELAEHRQNVTAAKAHLREYQKKLQPGAPAPDVPKPPS